MAKIYISNSLNPYFNVSLEKHLMDYDKEKIALYLWCNDKSVILGRNQNIYAECNTDYMKQNGIFPVRRLSGGGAVYHDPGNINFTFLCDEEMFCEKSFIDMVKSAMKSIGVECEFSGRNDILYKGRKFSGHAYLNEDNRYIYHGTVMVNVDFEELTKALTPSDLKLKSKGIDSVRSRVVNLSETDSNITVDKVSDAFVSVFREKYPDCEDITYYNENTINPEMMNTLSSQEWIYGESPDYNVSFEEKINSGNVTVNADVHNGIIKKIEFFTDSLNNTDFENIKAKLTGTVFDKENILLQLNTLI